jgi:hypothetical protein
MIKIKKMKKKTIPHNNVNRLKKASLFSLLVLAMLTMTIGLFGQNNENDNENKALGLEKGFVDYATSAFRLELLKSSQTVSSIGTTGEQPFNYTPGELLQQRSDNGYYHLGDINLRIRKGDQKEWASYSTALNRADVEEVKIDDPNTLVAADLAPTLPADIPVKITRSWEKHGDNIVMNFRIKNTSASVIEIGALGIPMIFNNNLNNKSLDEAHQDNVFFDPYIGMDGGYLQVIRLHGEDKVLLVVPEGKTPFEAYRPLNDDPTNRGITFEGFHEWMVHSKAYAENEWKDAEQWNKPSSALLNPGEEKSYGVKFILADDIRSIESTLAENQRPVAIGIPGYVIPKGTDARLFVQHSSEIRSFSVEPANALVLKKRKSAKNDWQAFDVEGLTWGRARITINYEDGNQQTINYKVVEPETEIVASYGRFLTTEQWFDTPDVFNRAPSVISYDYDKKEQVTQENRAWIAGLSDEGGAGSWLGAMMKQLIMPEPGELAKMEDFVNQTLWGGIQYSEGEKKYGVKKSLFFYDPEFVPEGTYSEDIPFRGWSAWSKEASESTGRSYNYPHVVAAHWTMYRLSRNYKNLLSEQDWMWYLENAFHTSLAMVKQAPHYAQFGQMEGTIFLLLLHDLKAEGLDEMVAELTEAMNRRAKLWFKLNYPFGSEMPWDSTGQEEVYMWSKYFGFDEKAMVTLNAILAYMPTVPHWAYNGNARRYWDFLFAGKQTRVERQIHHYGSGLNAIPVLHQYRETPDDFYLLRVGYGGLMGSISNITRDGFGPCALHSYPSSLKIDGYSGDYGPGFFGYAVNSATYLTSHDEFGWLSFGGNIQQKGKWIHVDLTTAAKSRFYLAEEGVWLELDAGKFKTVSYHTKSGKIKLTFEPTDMYTPEAYLRVSAPALESDIEKYAIPSLEKNSRGAYIVPLTKKNATLELGKK